MKIYFSVPILESTPSDFKFFDEIFFFIGQHGKIINLSLPTINAAHEINNDVLNQHSERRYEKMLNNLTAADIVIALATIPSIDVGYEIALANTFKKKTFILFNDKSDRKLPDRINGHHRDLWIYYHDLKSLKAKIRAPLKSTARDLAKNK